MKLISTTGALLLALLATSHAFADTSPDAAMDALHQAGAQANQDAFVALLADDVVFIGVEGRARMDSESVRDFVRVGFPDGGGWGYRSSDREVHLSTDGSVAWFDESLVHDQLGNGRGTGVLIRDGANWKVVQYSLIVPLPPEVVETPTGLKALFTPDAPGTPSKPECKKKRHKTNNRSDC